MNFVHGHTSIGMHSLPLPLVDIILAWLLCHAGPNSAAGSASDSRARGPRFVNTWSGHILSFLLPLVHKGQLWITGESMCTKYWLTA